MRSFVLLMLVFLVALGGCGLSTSTTDQPPRPTATIAPLFTGQVPTIPPALFPTAAPRPTRVVTEPPREVATRQAEARRDASSQFLTEFVIFDDQFAPGWGVSESWNMQFQLQNQFAASGRIALQATPLQYGFRGLFFANGPQGGTYPRAEVLGMRFYVSGGANVLEPDSLIVRVTGSNRYPYHVQGDTSVRLPERGADQTLVFPELGLSQFGLRRALEPGEWAEIEVWLDGYDQVDYTYVTGLVLMNDASYVKTFYVDRVVLLLRRS